jgi:hypothetical protein
VIVVVEGPSGAGKTTWCRTYGRSYALLEELPDHATVPTDPEAAARYWVERNVARWRQVMERERRDSLVVVDTSPELFRRNGLVDDVGSGTHDAEMHGRIVEQGPRRRRGLDLPALVEQRRVAADHVAQRSEIFVR